MMNKKYKEAWDKLPDMAKEIFKNKYFKDGENYEILVKDVTSRLSRGDKELQKKLEEYYIKQYIGFSTPITNRVGANISCFVGTIRDDVHKIIESFYVDNICRVSGGGIGRNIDIREKGAPIKDKGKSAGIMPILKIEESNSVNISQGAKRRGSTAIWIKVDHPEIMTFIKVRNKNTREEEKCENINTGIMLTKKFMEALKKCTTYKLNTFDGSDKELDAVEVMKEIISERLNSTGEPYLMFEENVKKGNPTEYKNYEYIEKLPAVETSNLCSEILLRTPENFVNVCCLSSINLAKYDEMKSEGLYADVIETLYKALDNTIDNYVEYIENNKSISSESKICLTKLAKEERPIGIGFYGLHTLFQKRMIPFISLESSHLESEIFKEFKKTADEINKKLALEKGACEMSKMYGREDKRNIHTSAIAPTLNLSTLGDIVSQGTDPVVSNAYMKTVAGGTFYVKNKELEKLLESKKLSKETIKKIWKKIIENKGSVENIDELNKNEKNIFKTHLEINQSASVIKAGIRNKYISQGISTNLFFAPDESEKVLIDTILDAYKYGVKTLYYQKSMPNSMGKTQQECEACQ